MTIKPKTPMKTQDYPFVKEIITDTEGTIQKVIIDFSDYQYLIEADFYGNGEIKSREENMSEQNLSSLTNIPSTEVAQENYLLAKLILEIQQTPDEYLPNLLQIVRLFRESVTMKPVSSDAWVKAMDEIKNPHPVKKAVKQIALSELLRKWEEDGDEAEQTETAEILCQTLEENPLSI